jgi:disulfide bond formation protein DsbB|tara:strand:- start:9955 stop:10440 length:486 start_codon:yes stop_codon:yes gene_type:complete
MDNLKKKTYLKFIFLTSFIVLVAAYAIQYLLGHQPCSLCIIERIPYALAIIILILNYVFKKNEIFYCILLLLIFAFSFLISIYHLGIEQGFIYESDICGVSKLDLITKEDILKSLNKMNINCKDVTFKILGLSLTSYNILVSIIMFVTSIKIYLINNEVKK